MRSTTSILAGLAAVAALLPVRTAIAQRGSDSDFTWEGRIPAGASIKVYDLNGSIEFSAADGSVASVLGEKKWRRGDPRDVHIQLVRDGDDVIICALWFEDATCDARGAHQHGHGDHDDNDVSVHFSVKVPEGVKIVGRSVNGAVTVRDASAEVDARTVNGQVEVATSTGPVDAETVNGSVRARIERLPNDDDLTFKSVNGSVRVELPSTLDADVEMATLNGGVNTDYPMTISGRISPRSLHATLGRGGRRITLKSVNGSVELRKLP
jgi:hypothetical protein